MGRKRDEKDESDFGAVDPEAFGRFVDNLKKANETFGVETSLEVLAQATLENIAPPDRVGGHDDKRGKSGGAQKKKDKLSSDHGINQSRQYNKFKDRVLQRRLQTLGDSALVRNGDDEARGLVKEYKKQQRGGRVL